MGNKIALSCIPRSDNRIAAYNFDHPDIANYSNNSTNPNNIQPVLIEGQLTYLDADKIVCSDEPCCICMDNLSCVRLNCGHNTFCWECIRELTLSGYKECPLCRTAVKKIDVCYNLEFNVFNN